MATMSLANVLLRLGAGAAISTSICTVQIDAFGHYLSQGSGVYDVNERLYVRVEYLWRLRLGANDSQIQAVTSNHRR